MKSLPRWIAFLVLLFSLLTSLAHAQSPDGLPPSTEKEPEAAPPSLALAVPGWKFQTVDARHTFAYSNPDRSRPPRHNLKFDSQGVAHVVYGGDHLYHAWRSPRLGAWFNEIIDPADDVGGYASLAIDAADDLHVAYYDAANKDLKYATTSQSTSWRILTLQSTGNVGTGTDIAVDQWNEPHIIYEDASQSKLYYTYADSGVGPGYWEPPELVSGTKSATTRFSMAFRNPLQIHVFFWEVTGDSNLVGTLYYTSTTTATRWQPKMVASGKADTGKLMDAAVDTSGYPNVIFSYADVAGGGLIEATRYLRSTDIQGTSWTKPYGDVVEVGMPGGLALRLDSANNPFIAMQTSGTLFEYYWESATWKTRTVSDTTNTGFFPAIALNSAGRPAFAYLNDPTKIKIFLNYRSWNGSSWNAVEHVDQSEEVGACSTVLKGPDGNPWVFYSGDTDKTLYFRRFYSNAWQAAVEVNTDQAGKINCAHAAAAGGGKAGVLYNTSDNMLYYSAVTCTGATCTFQPAVMLANPVSTPFFALDYSDNGTPYILYLDQTSSPYRMIIRYWNSTWLDIMGGPTSTKWGFEGRNVAMKRTANGDFHIIYQTFDSSNELYYVRYPAGGPWSAPSLLNSNEVAQGISLALDSHSQPGIAYSVNHLVYQLLLQQRYCISTICLWTTPIELDSNSTPYDLYFPNLAIDWQDQYHFSYVKEQGSTRVLTYARLSGASLTKQTLVTQPLLSTWSSLALSPTGRAWVSLENGVVGDLFLAQQQNRVYMPTVLK